MHLARLIDQISRNEGRRLLAGLIRLTGDFNHAEDALQEAFLRAMTAWPQQGIPGNPEAWLNTVSRRFAIDRMRRDRSTAVPDDARAEWTEPDLDDRSGIEDDRLRLLFTCCHPALSPEARCALALRTLGGLTTREIARAFLEPESTTAQRLVRAQRKIREAGIPYEIPARDKLGQRTATVLSVLYLIFNEGYASTEASDLLRPDLTREAIRLARLTVELLPDSVEARGLLALMLLTAAREPARLSESGDIVPLDEQNRSLWHSEMIDEGRTLLDDALALRAPGPYQIQAAIAALHDDAPTAAETDWAQIATLYRALQRWSPTAVIELNSAVAEGMAGGLELALQRIREIEEKGNLSGYHLLDASRADILRRLGRCEEAAASYRDAIARTTNPTEKRYLQRRLAQCE